MKLVLFVLVLASSSLAAAQGTTQIASTPPERAWWPSTSQHARPVLLHARDEQRLASWYVEQLGFQLAGLPSGVPGGARTAATTVYLGTFVLRVEQSQSEQAGHIVVAVKDLPARVHALQGAGIPLLGSDGHSARLRDPEGNLVELVEGR